MPRIITALFKDRAQAEQALQALLTTGIAQDRITTAGLEKDREVSSISGFRTLEIPDDIRGKLHGLGLPANDVTLFENGLRRGCSLIAARIDRDDHEEAIRVLEMFNPLDLDRDSREWAAESPAQEGAGQGGAGDVGGPLGAGISGGNADGLSNTGSVPGMGTLVNDGSSLGTADLRTGESGQPVAGAGSTVPTGQYTDGRRENLPGANELRQPSPSPQRTPDTGMLQREMNRRGPVWTYGTD